MPFEKNDLKNVATSVSLALSKPASDTGDSQFFINLANNAFLDGNYCVFGQVVKGFDVVFKIQKGDAVKSLVIK